MTKEEILEKHLKTLLNDRPGSYKEISEMKKVPEWQVVLNAMQEYADAAVKLFSLHPVTNCSTCYFHTSNKHSGAPCLLCGEYDHWKSK